MRILVNSSWISLLCTNVVNCKNARYCTACILSPNKAVGWLECDPMVHYTDHRENGLKKNFTRFDWKVNSEASEIVKQGKHNDFPSQIMLALDRAGIEPLPTSLQLNNHI